MAHLEFNHSGNYPGETRKRSLVKTIIYRIIIILADFLFLYVLTHKLVLSLVVMVVSNVYTALGYYAYERIWNKIRWGRTFPKAKRKRRRKS